ncbi:MAG: monovalent cation/H(+) antiporter subunit G [Candidatus Promineofilum sp.]|nr:monovalent cation/H(+) antiporter subunit G [Promineifilum sp.]
MTLEEFRALIAVLAILVGSGLSLIGVLGMVRLPDVYARLHATGKVGIYGAVLLLVAAAIWTPLGWGRAILLIVLLMITGPVTAHAISSAAYRIGTPMKNPIRDDLSAAEERPAPGD